MNALHQALGSDEFHVLDLESQSPGSAPQGSGISGVTLTLTPGVAIALGFWGRCNLGSLGFRVGFAPFGHRIFKG